jgi:FolB domain-containing protein
MDRIIIRDILARGIIGIHEWERNQPQEILINIVIEADLHKAGNSDDINDTISYSTIARTVKEMAESTQRLTVEALAEDIARVCLEEPRVQRIWVRVEKPGAVPFAGSVGVEIERGR